MLNFLFTHTPLTFLTQSLWRDEAFSYLLAKKNILQIITLSAKDFNPPLYYILLHLWIKIFGVTEISLRIFSFIFYWAILYVCAHFLQDIFKLNLKKSLLYFILFIFNPILSYYAFEARAYTLFAFLATLSYYSFYKRSFKLYLVATILGLYTHYFMLFVVFSQFIFIYLTQKGRRDYKNIKKV
ncbi:glycosyltransferase family 39 protein, partial [Candidatus Roizmanbacteria bacterium]|nr:glycosyltransferase family 39 protein [Candidatus Roizmanbacteria bacterium]